mgnify:CR=1 FL=1
MPLVPHTSVEAVFEDAVLADLEEESEEATEYGEAIDYIAGLSPLEPALQDIKEGVSSEMIDAILGDDEVTKMLDDEIAEDDLENEEDEEK